MINGVLAVDCGEMKLPKAKLRRVCRGRSEAGGKDGGGRERNGELHVAGAAEERRPATTSAAE